MSSLLGGVAPRLRPRTTLVVAAALLVGLLVFLAREALSPFLVGVVLAYLLTPPVRTVERLLPFASRRPDVARLVAVLLVYLGAVTVLALALSFGLPPLFTQISKFFADLPNIIEDSQVVVQAWLTEVQAHVPPEVQRQTDEAVHQLGAQIVGMAQEGVVRGFSVVFATFSVLLGSLTVPVWLFFVLKDRERFGDFLYRLFPTSIWPDVQAITGIVNSTLSAYIRAQLLLGLVIGVATAVGLSLMGIPFALVLGLIAGITEMIPVLGPILGSVAGIVVTLATMPDKWVLVLLFYLVVQQVENNLLVPRVQGEALELHPAVIMLLLVAASQLGGFLGMLVAAPLAAMARDIFIYLYRRLDGLPATHDPTIAT